MKTMAELKAHCEKTIRSEIEENGTVWSRVLIVADKALLVFQYPGENDQEREKLRELIAKVILIARLADKLDAVAMIGEVWYLDTKDPSITLENAPRPKDHPDRKEAVTYECFKGLKGAAKLWEIKRTDGAPIELVEKWESGDGTKMEGWLRAAVQTEPPPPPIGTLEDMKAMARELWKTIQEPPGGKTWSDINHHVKH